jgi:hypothetical protein
VQTPRFAHVLGSASNLSGDPSTGRGSGNRGRPLDFEGVVAVSSEAGRAGGPPAGHNRATAGPEPRWYLIRCVARGERWVEAQARAAGYEAYAPRVPKTRRRDGSKALLPGLRAQNGHKTGTLVCEPVRTAPAIFGLCVRF